MRSASGLRDDSWLARKGAADIVAAFGALAARRADLKLVLMGTGASAEAVQSWFPESPARAGLRIRAAGHRSAELAEQMLRAAVYLIPSLFEGTPQTLVEAMATGLASVATATCGMKDVIQDGANGLLVPVRDPVALAAATERLLAGRELRERLGRQAHADAAMNYTWDKVAEPVPRSVSQTGRAETQGDFVSVLSHYLKWQFGFAPAETQTTEAERVCLARHATGRRVLAEIGVWHGVTTCRLRAVMAADGILYAVDPYPRGRLGVSFQQRIAHSELARVKGGEIRWIRSTGAEAGRQLAAELAGRVDFLFIDGDHTYEGLRGDWEAWSGSMTSGGIVGLHDSRSSPLRAIDDAGSVRFTSEVIRKDERFRLAGEVDSLTVLERQPR